MEIREGCFVMGKDGRELVWRKFVWLGFNLYVVGDI